VGNIFELDRVLQGMDKPKKVLLRDMTIAPRGM
jgi:hypothetical protein